MKDKKVNRINELRQAKELLGFDPLLKVGVAAEMLGLDEQTLYGWIHDGKFEAVKVGVKSLRIRPEVVRAFMESAKEKAHMKVA